MLQGFKHNLREQKKLILICMIGAPCSGKSTWIEKWAPILYTRHQTNVIVISRDNIRDSLFGKKYKQNTVDEQAVTRKFYEQLSTCATLEHGIIILDNCHMNPNYLKEYYYTFHHLINSGKMEFYIEFFQIPLWKARVRNFRRRLRTGKWIPDKVLKSFYNPYRYIAVREILKNVKFGKYSDKYGK